MAHGPVAAITAAGAAAAGDAAFFAQAKDWLLALACATTRIQIALGLLPIFNKQIVPGMIRTAVGVCLSLIVVPGVHAALRAHPPDTVGLCAVLLKESFIGLLIGYGVAVLFWAVEGMGFFIDNQRGASIASTLNPLTGNDSSPLGILFNQAFIVYFVIAGGLPLLCTLLYRSYAMWPVMTWFPTLRPESGLIYAAMFQNLVKLALLLSAPVIVAMMLAELGLALVSRFAPQMPVFFMAMPIKSGLAMCLLALYLPTLFDLLQGEIGQLPTLLEQIGRSLG